MAGAMDWELAAAAAEAGALRIAPMRHAQSRSGPRPDGEDPRPHQEAHQSQFLLSHAAGAQQRARGQDGAIGWRPITASSASIRRRRSPRATARRSTPQSATWSRRSSRCGQLPFRAAGTGPSGTGQGRGRRGAELGHDRGRGTLARGARRRRGHRAGQRGGRPPRHVSERRHRHPGRYVRARSASRRRRQGAGDRGGRHHRCARHRGGVRARGGRHADRHRISVVAGGEDFGAASCRPSTAHPTTARR